MIDSPNDTPNPETALARRRYDRIAPVYDIVEWFMELRASGWRRQLWSLVEGERVLEIGVGTGASLRHHPRGKQLVALDISERMRPAHVDALAGPDHEPRLGGAHQPHNGCDGRDGRLRRHRDNQSLARCRQADHGLLTVTTHRKARRNNMRWIAGLDLIERSRGAARFAAWMRERTGGHLMGAHVVETMPYAFSGPGETAPDFGDWVLRRTREFAEEIDVADAFDTFDAIEASAPEDGLVAAIEQGRGDALVIGRRAPRAATGLIRLGRVARRLVRVLPAPVVVVPPDLMAGEIGDGPVVVGTDFADDSRSALRFGRELARALERELVLVHVATTPRSIQRYLPRASRKKAAADHVAHVQTNAKGWSLQHGLEDTRLEVVSGTIAPALVTLATDEDACLVVVGSRRLSVAERLFLSSVGSELAASSPIAVAIIPPSDDA